MNRIQNAIKCAHCHEILQSPVIIPCNHIICKIHVLNQKSKIIDFIRCEKCEIQHLIPSNGFQPVSALQEIIEAEIANIDLGSVYKSAKKSCESFGETLKELDNLLNDPKSYTQLRISELENNLKIKGEELKSRIDQEMNKYINRLKEYESECTFYSSFSNEFKEESQKLKNESKRSKSNLNSLLENLNK